MNTINISLLAMIFLSSGLFMGWSLGANDAANIFGTAVGTKMIKFSTAAAICSVFVIIGAVVSGAGASGTLGALGAVNTMAAAFSVSLAAAITVMGMTGSGLPVSTSQAVVGAIIGWNLYVKIPTDISVLKKIVITWVATPILAAVFSGMIYLIVKAVVDNTKIHILKLYKITRIALLISGAFGAYSLGANNIANVMGVFVKASPFKDLQLSNGAVFSGTQQLFLLGGIAISIGVITYSKKVIMTVGSSIFKLSPISACVVVFASSAVLFLFSSASLYEWLVSRNLPPFPLIPVSQSQAVVGAIIGIGIAKKSNNINYKQLGVIGIGWVLTPVISLLISILILFIVNSVFGQAVI